MTSATEEAYWNLCSRHEFERVCGADVKYVSHNLVGDKMEFIFEIPALDRKHVVGMKPEGDIVKLATSAGKHAQSLADSKLGKFDARIALAKLVNEEKASV